MRTLLIDNHDSFTYNLFQYLTASNAEAPLVVKNDEMSWDDVERLDFDNIVISPGPGRPQHSRDLGLSADALRRARVPLLGVCLGHQAIGHFCGATVDLAMRPMHGRLDRISHSQRDLFRGIPDRFEAVRYHSLAVTHLPRDLLPLAWADDGTLMAMRHAAKPWWGVQFHPESICTEYGARLLRNFRELTDEWRTAPPRRDPMGSCVPAFRVGRPPDLRSHARCLDVCPKADAAFTLLFAEADASFWLDSSLSDRGRARFSFMGDASGPHASTLSYRSSATCLEIHRSAVVESRNQSIFDYLRDEITGRRPEGDLLPFDFTGGFVGYLGYELKQELGGQDMHDASTPDAMGLMSDRFIAFDHAQQQTWIVCLDGHSLCDENHAWLEATERSLRQLEAQPPHSADVPAAAVGTLEWRVDLQKYHALVLRCQEEILQGETYEVCLTNQLSGEGTLDVLAVYNVLRARNPAPYAALFRCAGVSVLCASPELFLRIGEDRTVEARPIKGTAPRGATSDEDQVIAARLRTDEKSRAENLMIVDLLRNDLNRVCDPASVHVPNLFDVETFATVHQLVSSIRGRLRPDRHPVDCVRAAFPGGSMTGAPKIRTMKIIDELEGCARGVYSGSMGYFSLSGAVQLNIVIRTIVCANGRVSVGSGGAIVAMSDPAAEVQEIVLKAHAQQEVLRECGAAPSALAADTGRPPPPSVDA